MLTCEKCGKEIVWKHKMATQARGAKVKKIVIIGHLKCMSCGQEMIVTGEGRTVMKYEKTTGTFG